MKVYSTISAEGCNLTRMETDVRQVHDSLTEMIKQLANEPSLGLFFVQQHVHKVLPTVVSLKAQLVNESQEAVLCTEDARDALTAVRTMKDVGPSTIEKMKAILDSTLSSLQHQQNVKRSRVPVGSPISEDIGQVSTVKCDIASVDASRLENTASASRNFPTTSEWHSETSSSSYIPSTFGSVLRKASSIGWKTSASQVGRNTQTDATKMAEVGSFLNTTAEALKDFALSKPARYVRAVFDPKQQVSDIEGKDDEKCGYPNGSEEVGSDLCTKTLVLEDTYKQFQEEHQAKLEAWLENAEEPASR